MGMPQGSGNHILNVLVPTHAQGDPEVGVGGGGGGGGATIDRCIIYIHNTVFGLRQYEP